MSRNSFSFSKKLLLYTLLSLLLCASSFGADHIAQAKRFLGSLYPELNHRSMNVEIKQFWPDGNRISIELTDYNPCGCAPATPIKVLPSFLPDRPLTFPLFKGWPFSPPESDSKRDGDKAEARQQDSVTAPIIKEAAAPPDQEPDNNRVLWAEFNFGSKDPPLLHFYLTEREADTKSRRYKKSVLAHPEWSEEQALQELRSEGAMFGPDKKSELLRLLPYKQLEPLIGKVEIKSVDFDFHRFFGDDSGADPEVFMRWIVHVTARLANDKKQYYFMNFEPFGGKLTSIYWMPPPISHPRTRPTSESDD